MTDEEIAIEAAVILYRYQYQFADATVSDAAVVILDAIKRAKCEDKEKLEWREAIDQIRKQV